MVVNSQTASNVIAPAQFRADGDLVTAFLSDGRPEAASTIYDRHAPSVLRVLQRILGPSEDCTDQLQEVFAGAFRGMASLQDRERLRPWLISIAVRTASNALRSKRRRISAIWWGDEEPAAESGPGPEARPLVEQTYAVLSEMPTEERVALVLRYLEQYSVAEIAALTDTSGTTVKRRISRGIERLRALSRRYPEVASYIGEVSDA